MIAAQAAQSHRRVLMKRAAVLILFFGAIALGFLRCPLALIAHVPCPGCGLTRATASLVHGDVEQAIAFHPLVFVLAPGILLFSAYSAVEYMKTGTFGGAGARAGRVANAALVVLCLAMIGVWIARFFGAFGGPAPV